MSRIETITVEPSAAGWFRLLVVLGIVAMIETVDVSRRCQAGGFSSGFSFGFQTRRCEIIVVGICQDCEPVKTGDNLAQKFDPFASNIGGLARQPSDVTARPRQTRDYAGINWVGRVANTIGI
jgi:hypothetical protein